MTHPIEACRHFCFMLVLISIATIANAAEADRPAGIYQVSYEANLDPLTGRAQASLTLTQASLLVRSVSFTMPGDRYLDIASETPLTIEGDRVSWQPGADGGTLTWEFVVDHRRSGGALDSRMTTDWALLKLDHLFPGATTRSTRGAVSRTSFRLSAPATWSIETPYGFGADQVFHIDDPGRGFDQPKGWVLAGKIGVRREKIGERHVSVASPLGTGFRANDLLAFLHWTLPELVRVVPDLSPRLLIVSGSDDMWRGGLSGRSSLYLHPDRPLLSGNRTSTVLHELFHVASRLRGKPGADWIVEGLAEYYSLTLLARAGGISPFRYEQAFDKLAEWSAGTPCAATDRSQGKSTAAAALVMRELDREIATASGGTASLDSLVQALVANGPSVSNNEFRAAASKLTGGSAKALTGCPG